MSRSPSPVAVAHSHMRHLEQHVQVLDAAYQEERRQRDLLEKKYARLKRRFLRLERAHARLIVTQEEAYRSAERSSRQQQQQEQEQERSPERFARSSLNADVIDLTRGTQEEYTDLYFAARQSRPVAPTRTALADDFCAESPDSTRDGDESSEISTPARGGERASRRQLSFLREQRFVAPASRNGTAFEETDDSDLGFRVASSGSLASTRTAAVSRPRPRLGALNSPVRRIRREPEQDRDYELSRRRRTGAAAASPSSSAASSPTTINSSPRSSTGHDNDDAASLALAQYLQQQENIAAFEEYTARAQAARGAASNQFAYDDDSARAPHGGAGSLGGREIDPDNMTYDELLRLGEQNGDVKKERWRQMAVQVISCLPTHRWRGGGNNSDASCIICQYSFAENDRALSLPCAHVFHEECVDGWIRENNSCPLCKLEIVPM